MSFYSRYPAGSMGRVIHFLRAYCQYHVAETATIGNGCVTYYGEKVADIEEIHGGLPVFLFTEKYKHAAEQQRNKMLTVLQSCFGYNQFHKPGCEGECVFLGSQEIRPIFGTRKETMEGWFDVKAALIWVCWDGDIGKQIINMSFFGSDSGLHQPEIEFKNRARQFLYASRRKPDTYGIESLETE